MDIAKIVAAIIGVVVFVIVISLICAIPVWLLWNWLIPVLFKGAVATITLVQAWGVLVLCGLLFKSTTTVRSS